MILPSLFASLHYLALPVGLGGLWMRGRYILALSQDFNDSLALERLFIADNFWGAGALLWILTGLMRAFGGLEKGSSFYLHSHLFWVKMGLFATVAILEVLPMSLFIRWRLNRKSGRPLKGEDKLLVLRRINAIEAVLVFLIPFVASAMARGLG